MVRVAVTCAFTVMARSGRRPGTGGPPRGTGRDPVAILRYVSCAFRLEDTEGVNREHAETYLRLVAEAELRRATTPPRHGAAAA